MPARRRDDEQPRSRRLPARTFEAEEDRLIDLATQVVEQQMRDGTVSSQVLTHYLRLGSSRGKLESKRLEGEIALNKIRADAIAAEKRMEELAEKVVQAMTEYRPTRRPPWEVEHDD